MGTHVLADIYLNNGVETSDLPQRTVHLSHCPFKVSDSLYEFSGGVGCCSPIVDAARFDNRFLMLSHVF